MTDEELDVLHEQYRALPPSPLKTYLAGVYKRQGRKEGRQEGRQEGALALAERLLPAEEVAALRALPLGELLEAVAARLRTK